MTQCGTTRQTQLNSGQHLLVRLEHTIISADRALQHHVPTRALLLGLSLSQQSQGIVAADYQHYNKGRHSEK
jgi:hypothetical protein